MKKFEMDTNKKILLYASGNIINTRQTGGVKRFIELALYGAKKKNVNGYNVNTELCSGDNEYTLERVGLKAKYHMRGLPNEGFLKFLPPEAQIFLYNSRVLNDIRNEKYDAIVVFDVPPAIGLCLAGIKDIVLMIRKDMIGYERANISGKASFSKKVKIAMQWLSEGITLLRVKTIICQCEYDRAMLVKRHRLLGKYIKSKFRIQINNVNPSWIVNNSISNEIVKLDRSKDEFLVCFIGGFEDLRKGQDLFLRAAQSIVKETKMIRFILIGGGKNLDIYKQEYRHNQIEFWGRMDNPLSVLKKTDLLVVPSLADSCPNTVMEALYNGIPVIGSNAGGIPEILNDKDVLFDLEWNILKEKITEVYQNKIYYRKIKERQKKRKEELSFDWPKKIFELFI